MIIAGIDPGTIRMGLAILEERGTSFRTIDLAVLHGRHGAPRWKRLGDIFTQLMSALMPCGVRVVAIETAYVGKDPRAAIAIGEARGVAFAAAHQVGAEVIELGAAEARKAAIGKGNADKHQVRKLMMRILGIEDVQLPLDATDAACLAMAGAARARTEKMIKEATRD